MNVEELRNYALGLGSEVEEKFPFQQFAAARDVLAFYTHGHMFLFFDINHLEQVNLKAPPEEIESLKEQHSFIGNPYNCSSKYWIGVDATVAPAHLLRSLVAASYGIVAAGGNKRRRAARACPPSEV